MRTLTIAFLVAVAIHAAFAEPRFRPTTADICKGDHYSWKDYSSSYSPNATVPRTVCIFSDYEVECPEITGLVGCDLYDSVCVEYAGEENWKSAAALNGYTSTNKPKKCIKVGGFWFPDSRVVSTAQVILTVFGILWASFVVFFSIRSRSIPTLAWISLGLMLPAMIVMTVSYYYLNVIIVLACTLAALALFSEKTPLLTSIGMLILLSGLFWVTYNAGLGNIQHHDRRNAGPSFSDTFEKTCQSYYRGYFFKDDVRMADDDNPLVRNVGYCSRAFLAAQLFLMILLELLLVLTVVSGVSCLNLPTLVSEAPREEPLPLPEAGADTAAIN